MRGISKESSQTDILPTVLDILNFPVPYAAMDNSLLDETAAHFAFTSRNEHILGFRYSFGIVEHTGTAHVQSTLRRRTKRRNEICFRLTVPFTIYW